MLIKSITYTDFLEKEHTEDFYFHLSKAEIAELHLGFSGGLSEYLEEVIKAEDGEKIIQAFKKIIRASVGKRSEDGKKFVKNDEVVSDFMDSPAYSVMFMELVTDSKAATEFIKGIVPKDMVDKIEENVQNTPQIPSSTDFENMSPEELRAYIKDTKQK